MEMFNNSEFLSKLYTKRTYSSKNKYISTIDIYSYIYTHSYIQLYCTGIYYWLVLSTHRDIPPIYPLRMAVKTTD